MAQRKQYVIYVPGIKDDLFRVQSLAIQCWRLRGVHPVMCAMPWFGKGDFEPKLARLLSKVDNYHQQGYDVSLVGASAGASAVLNAYGQRKNVVQSVAYVCGKINFPESVSERTYAQNPAFKTSMLQLQQTLQRLTDADKRKICSFYSSGDTIVTHENTTIKGVAIQKLPAFSHLWAILFALTFGSGKVLGTLRKLGAQSSNA